MFHLKRVLFLSVLVLLFNQSFQSPVKSEERNVDLNVYISCIANSTCVKNVANKVVRALNLKKVIDFGVFSIEPLNNGKKFEGRSMSKLYDIANNNALRVPIGSYSLMLKKSEEYDNYLEFSISKAVEGKKFYKRYIVSCFQRDFAWEYSLST